MSPLATCPDLDALRRLTRGELREAESRAKQQQHLTESELSITIQTNQGKAEYQRSLQQASQMKAMADKQAEPLLEQPTLVRPNPGRTATAAQRVGLSLPRLPPPVQHVRSRTAP